MNCSRSTLIWEFSFSTWKSGTMPCSSSTCRDEPAEKITAWPDQRSIAPTAVSMDGPEPTMIAGSPRGGRSTPAIREKSTP